MNHRSHAIHSFDEISDVGFEKMISASEPAAAPRSVVSLNTPKKELCKRGPIGKKNLKEFLQTFETDLGSKSSPFRHSSTAKKNLELSKNLGYAFF